MERAPLYQSLNEETHEIRLLRIRHSNDKVNIQCDLKTVSLDKQTLIYHALSYEWGAPREDSPLYVFVNSYQVVTTPNLRLALEHLQKDEYYWVDFLCVNQSDDIERAQQVRLMTRIYQTAYSVVIWLGPEEGDSSRGIALLNEFEAKVANSRIPRTVDRCSYAAADLWIPGKEAFWDGFCQLLSRSYWTRLWTIQEIVVATHPERLFFYCGSRYALFTSAANLIKAVDDMVYLADTQPNRVDPAAGSWVSISRRIMAVSQQPYVLSRHSASWRAGTGGNRISLLRLLGDYSFQECSDPRDRVYALLGVSMPYPELELDISYTIPVPEVYKNAAQYIIQGSNRLDILLHCQTFPSVDFIVPSWVPDWAQYTARSRVIRRRGQTWDASKSIPVSFKFSIGGSTLFTKAMLLGPIAIIHTLESDGRNDVGSSLSDSAITMEEKQGFFTWLTFAKRHLEAPDDASWNVTMSDTTPSEATMRTLYAALVFTTYGFNIGAKVLPLEDFFLFCEELYIAGVMAFVPSDWPLIKRVILRVFDVGKRLFAFRYPIVKPGAKPESASAAQRGPGNIYSGTTTIGLCPLNTKEGDMIAIVVGCKHPVVLRNCRGRWEVVGEVYLHGVMDGEAVGKFEVVDIKLV